MKSFDSDGIRLSKTKNKQLSIHCVNQTDECPLKAEIAELEAEVVALRAQVNIDPLTKLYNRRYFEQSLPREMERTQRTRIPTCLIMIDIDHFKSVNDRFGHKVGDITLESVAKIIKQSCRKLDIPCRFGGEEFSVILPSTPLLVGIQVAERLRKSIALQDIETLNGNVINITASFGIDSFIESNTFSSDELVVKTDALLYQAKHRGRNRVCHSKNTDKKQSVLSLEEKNALFDVLKPNGNE